jgi:DNA-binding MarR family transcriptional regulator
MKIADSQYCHCLYFTASTLARKVDKLARESWKRVNLSPSHAYLLMLVIEQPGIQPKTLAAHLQLQPSTITRLMEKLENKKLVIRVFKGKLTMVYPTVRGRDLSSRLKGCLQAFYSSYCEVLGKQHSARFVQQIARMADQLAG